jgi:hypothetical protein
MGLVAKLTETQIQQHCVKLLNSFARYDIEWHHVPNGEQRSKKTAQRLKSLGVQPGVADLLFLIDGHSWAVELKTTTGTQSKAQADYQERFERAGGTYRIVFGLEQAISILINLNVFRPNIHISLNELLK